MKYNNVSNYFIKILKKLWRNKNSINLKIIKKIRLLKDKSNKKFMYFKTPTRLDKAKKYGYLKKPNYGIVKIKLKKRKDKKKVKKVFSIFLRERFLERLLITGFIRLKNTQIIKQ